MSINEGQSPEAPFIAFHAKFGASELFSGKTKRFLVRASPLIASMRSFAVPSEATKVSRTGVAKFAHFTCRAIFLDLRTAQPIVSLPRQSWIPTCAR